MAMLLRNSGVKRAQSVLRNILSKQYKNKQRHFAAQNGNASDVPLSQPLPWLAPPKFASATENSAETRVTVLENGLQVASENQFGQFCTVGVLINSGSRYETSYPSGITHFLEKLAFTSTSKMKSRDEILQILENHGGICDCQGSKDTLVYGVSANRNGLQDVIDILSEAVLRPKFSKEEVEAAGMAIKFDLDSLNMNPDPEILLIELIHAAAFQDNTLGLPRLCPEESIAMISRDILYTYMNSYHSPSRMVLAGVGIDHDELVELAKQNFVQKTPIWIEENNLIEEGREMDLSISQYTGGYLPVEKDLSNVSLGPSPMPELAHIVMALESCSHQDPDFIAFCVLNMMMGGGGSFSAGGPGKGMYTRLYTNVLNRYHWIHNATAFNHAYNDGGTFCIHASAHPSQLKDLTEVVVRELINTRHGVSSDELNRAKTQLQSMLLMNLESRPVLFEDIGRQVLASGHRKPAKYYFEEISKIKEEDIQRVASRMLMARPAVVGFGELGNMPSFNDIQSALASKDGRMPRRFSLFR